MKVLKRTFVFAIIIAVATSVAIEMLLWMAIIALWGPKSNDLGVVYLQDYDCSMKLAHAKEECEAYAQLIHRVWIDNPSYVEDVLSETDEFCKCDSLSDWGDIFEFWSDEDSIAYHENMEMQEIEAHLYLTHYCQPDTIPSQAPQDKVLAPVQQYGALKLGE